MTITPDQARELLYGTTPGPWEMVYEEWENPEGIPCESWTVCDKSDGLMDATDFDTATHDPAANTSLAAAAPDMAETIAGMRWQYGVIYEDGGEWPMVPDSWWPSIDAAIINHRRMNLDGSAPAHRIVRRLAGPVEVVE